MTDTIDDSLEALRDEISQFCEEHDIEPDEAEFNLEISYNLEFISSATINGIENLIEGLEETIKGMDTEAIIFFISKGDKADLIIRIGLFRDMGRWFALI